MKYLTKFYEVPLINLLRKEDLRKLNSLFNTTYKPEKLRSTARIIEQVRREELYAIDRLMREKPVGGGYGI